jgi:hypothetical protein
MDRFQDLLTFGCQDDASDSLVFGTSGTSQETPSFQSRRDVRKSGVVDTDFVGQSDLFQPRIERSSRHNAVLHRRDIQGSALFGKERNVNLVNPPD